MQEHPIPQDVTGYKFHIVGNMTLKQFAEVGAGVVVAIILYNTNLISVVKWPLIVLAVGLGGAMAFMPIEERPLDHWIITFFRRLYSPTKFYWRKENTVPFALSPTKQGPQAPAPQVEVDLTPARRKRITEYLESVKQPPPLEEWETHENSRVSQILHAFGSVAVENVDSKPAQPGRPQLSPRVRALASAKKSPPQKQVVFQAPEPSAEKLAETSPPAAAFEPSQPSEDTLTQKELEETNESTEAKETDKEPVIFLRPNEPVGAITTDGEFSPTPQQDQVRKTAAEKMSSSEMVIPPKTLAVAERKMPLSAPQPIPQVFSEVTGPSDEKPMNELPPAAKTNADLPFSEKQLAPNTVVGMVLTKDKKLIDRAVVKIKNVNGRVIRALRTNLLGQFFATAPLPNGTYLISAEKEGFSFPEQTVALNGNIPAPLEIKAA